MGRKEVRFSCGYDRVAIGAAVYLVLYVTRMQLAGRILGHTSRPKPVVQLGRGESPD